MAGACPNMCGQRLATGAGGHEAVAGKGGEDVGAADRQSADRGRFRTFLV